MTMTRGIITYGWERMFPATVLLAICIGSIEGLASWVAAEWDWMFLAEECWARMASTTMITKSRRLFILGFDIRSIIIERGLDLFPNSIISASWTNCKRTAGLLGGHQNSQAYWFLIVH